MKERTISGIELPIIQNSGRIIVIIDNSLSSVNKIIIQLIEGKQRGLLIDMKRDVVLNINSDCVPRNIQQKIKRSKKEKVGGHIYYNLEIN